MRAPRVLSLKTADAPRHGVNTYGTVQSISNPSQNHTVVKRGRKWVCTCPHHIFRGAICKHIIAARALAARRRVTL
jgi:hypothetical protein